MAAGITELREIVNANGTHVLSAMDMKRKYGQSIQTSQIRALHRIAYMLHTERNRPSMSKQQTCPLGW
jgi:hypothetical protein